jgi:hypothetical protein
MSDLQIEHPTGERLTAFGLGQLPDAELAEVEAHLAHCTACRQAAEGVADDTLIALLRSAATEPDSLAREDGPQAPTQTAPGSARAAGVDVGLATALADHPRYRVHALLGVGGMGVVYRAEHLLMQRPVALKVINRGLIGEPAAVERFRREVRAAAQLTHPNIVAAFDAEQAGDLHFLVMEYVDGVCLARHIAEHGPLPVAEACDYVRQAALGLQHAFEKGMVHRDIKPHNLMRTPDGQIKILDFGLARFALESAPAGEAPAGPRSLPGHEGGPAGPLTQTGMVMGSPDYLAPEQARDPHAADIRADTYSLGCTLYHLLAGRPPFAEGTTAQKVKAHTDQAPEPLGRVRQDVPPGLTRVVERMMAKDPADRFQTPAEVAEALTPFLAAAPRPPRRKKWPWLAAAVAVAAALLAGVIIRVQTNRGTFVIDASGDKVAVLIERAGGVKVVDQANGREYLLKPGAHDLRTGDYKIEVSDALAGLTFETKEFKLTRGKEVRVTARFVPKGVAGPVKATVVRLIHAEAAMVAQLLAKLLPDSGGTVSLATDAQTNSLIVRASAERTKEVKDLVRMLDVEGGPPNAPGNRAGRGKGGAEPGPGLSLAARKARLATLQNIVADKEKRYEHGTIPVREVLEARLQVRRAELDLCTSDKGRVAVHERIVALARDMEKAYEALYQAGRVPALDLLKARADRLAAETDLERARARAAREAVQGLRSQAPDRAKAGADAGTVEEQAALAQKQVAVKQAALRVAQAQEKSIRGEVPALRVHVRDAQTAESAAKDEYKVYERLGATGAITLAEVQERKTRWQTATSRREVAEADVAQCQLRVALAQAQVERARAELQEAELRLQQLWERLGSKKRSHNRGFTPSQAWFFGFAR